MGKDVELADEPSSPMSGSRIRQSLIQNWQLPKTFLQKKPEQDSIIKCIPQAVYRLQVELF
jgi:hypothetical protein